MSKELLLINLAIKKRLPEVKPLIKEVLEEMDKEISEEAWHSRLLFPLSFDW